MYRRLLSGPSVIGVLALLGALLALACGIPQEDYDAIKSQLATEQQQAASLEQQLSAKVQEAATVQQQVTAKEGEITTLKAQIAAKEGDATTLKAQITAKEKEAADLKTAATAKDKEVADLKASVAAKEKAVADLEKAYAPYKGVTPLIWAKVVPTNTPRPTATPLPAGVTPPTPAPPAKPDQAFLDEVIPFAFYVETLATSSLSKYGMASYPACVPNSQFQRGTKLVWRYEIIDTKTGKRVTSVDNPTVQINLPNGEKLTSRYSKRGGVGAWTWSGGWDIPPDFPLGAFNYTITVTMKDGRTGIFDPNKVALIRPATATSAGIDSRVMIVP